MAQFIGAVAVDGEPRLFDLPLCVCGMPAEDNDPQCADCLTLAELEAEEVEAERWAEMQRCWA